MRLEIKSRMRIDFALPMVAESIAVKNMSKDYHTGTHPCYIPKNLSYHNEWVFHFQEVQSLKRFQIHIYCFKASSKISNSREKVQFLL